MEFNSVCELNSVRWHLLTVVSINHVYLHIYTVNLHIPVGLE